MIDITVASKKKYGLTSYSNPSSQSQQTQVLQSPVVLSETNPKLLGQALERDRIIKKMLEGIRYKEGDIVTPHTPSEQKKRGVKFEVELIVQSYIMWTKYSDKKWPDNNLPYIVHCKNLETGESIICTPGYMVPYVETNVAA